MERTLVYYFEDGTCVVFNKYSIYSFGYIKNKKNGCVLCARKNIYEYNSVGVSDDEGNRRQINIGRAIASTFIGRPPTVAHTADHIDRNPGNDTLDNIRWLGKSEQNDNQECPETRKSAFIVIKDSVENTVKDWVEHFNGDHNHMKRKYTKNMIENYASQRKHGFAYKEYPDLPEEVWKLISESKTGKGFWEISNMNRVKYITKYGENVLYGERLGVKNGYPKININGRLGYCHILSFKTFFPEEYAAKKPGEMVLHDNDDKLDFRPSKLRLGTNSDNSKDAYDNGCHDGKQSARQKCASYIQGVFEKEHDSQTDAVNYLKCIGYNKASAGSISGALNGGRKTAYDRVWTLI